MVKDLPQDPDREVRPDENEEVAIRLHNLRGLTKLQPDEE